MCSTLIGVYYLKSHAYSNMNNYDLPKLTINEGFVLPEVVCGNYSPFNLKKAMNDCCDPLLSILSLNIHSCQKKNFIISFIFINLYVEICDYSIN